MVQRCFLSHLLYFLLQTTKIKVQKFKTFTYIFTWSCSILTSSLFHSQKTTPHKSPYFSSFICFLFLVFKFSYWLQRFHIAWSSNPFSWCLHTSLLCLRAHSINAFMPPNCHLPKITSSTKKSRKVELDIKCFKKG